LNKSDMVELANEALQMSTAEDVVQAVMSRSNS